MKRLYSLITIISFCAIAFAQHPHSRGGNPLYWGIVGGLGALICYLLYLSIGSITGLIKTHLSKKKDAVKENSDEPQSFGERKNFPTNVDSDVSQERGDANQVPDTNTVINQNPISEKKYCRYCGKQIPVDSIYCSYCGRKQKESLQDEKDKSSTDASLLTRIKGIFNSFAGAPKKVKIPKMSNEKRTKMRNIIKKIGKVLLITAIIGVIVLGCIGAYSYYYDEYLPKERLNGACAEIINNLHSRNEAQRIKISKKILLSNANWGYKDVDDSRISSEMRPYRSEALKNIENTAYKGDASVQYLLGEIYIGTREYKFKSGDTKFYEPLYVIDPDTAKAIYWWNEAAKRNYTPAFNNMGLAYKYGVSVPQNWTKAIEFLKTGAEKGDANAQVNYGILYRDGVRVKSGSHKEIKRQFGYSWEGEKIKQYYDTDLAETVIISRIDVNDYKWLIPENIEEAKKWWRMAAAQGNQKAKELLQKVYE